MERYEAILEQLKKAQGRGMETITNRLDLVVQSLEEQIQEAKTSIRDALPDSANECLPMEEVEAALEAYRDEAVAERQRAAALDARVSELELATDRASGGAPIELIRALDRARSQSELLKELLPAISEHAARAVVLVLRDGTATAWSGIGFTNGELLRSWQGDTGDSPALSTMLDSIRPVRFSPEDDDLFSRWLTDEEMPGQVLLIPVVLRGKLMGTVYIDQIEGHPWNPDTAQTLVAQVCWLIDTLGFRPDATPTLAEPLGISALAEAADVGEAPELPVEEPEPEVEPVVEAEAEEEFEAETEEGSDVEPTEEVETEEEFEAEPVEDDQPVESDDTPDIEVDPSATMKVDVSGMDFTDTAPLPVDEIVDQDTSDEEPEIAAESFEPDEVTDTEPEVEIAGDEFEPEEPSGPELDTAQESEFVPEVEPSDEVVDEEPAETEAVVEEPEPVPAEVQMPETPADEEEPESSSSQFLDEPPPVQPVQPPPDEPEREVSDDEAQQEEARRFARLLVSEIKLYNEEQVERGRESGDLYQRLQEDIDRSREMFDKRISEDIRARQDYFQDELVRILADGDPDVLGM